MLPYVPAAARRILDVGCGAGRFGLELKRARGAEVLGVEPDAAAAAQARAHLDRTFDTAFEAAPLPAAHFDCIVFNDSLEHMLEPEAALRRARTLLAPGGAVVASIPNVREYGTMKDLLVNQDWRYVDAGILDRTHLRFFTKKSMLRLFETCGFAVERIEGINRIGRSRALWLLNLLTGNRFEDMYFMQFAVVARAGGAAT
jgi:2-polyprenyl-3-methyl-5-hydroxy-6-metoxy-1,4-benzoquinol methylase